jgi:hypothetical protein
MSYTDKTEYAVWKEVGQEKNAGLRPGFAVPMSCRRLGSILAPPVLGIIDLDPCDGLASVRFALHCAGTMRALVPHLAGCGAAGTASLAVAIIHVRG